MIATPNIIRAKRNIIRSGGCDYESGGGFDCFLIVLISSMAADVVMLDVLCIVAIAT